MLKQFTIPVPSSTLNVRNLGTAKSRPVLESLDDGISVWL